MTTEQQRSACGWIRCNGWHRPDGRDELPDYLRDLTAMAEAERLVTDNTGYVKALKEVAGEYLSPFALVTATASQRAGLF